MPENTKSKIYQFFTEYGTKGDATELANLDRLQWKPFRASSDDQLLPVRQLVLFKDRLKLINSGKSTPEQIAEIDDQLAVLNRRMAALSAMAAN